jgi:hypothetical protein
MARGVVLLSYCGREGQRQSREGARRPDRVRLSVVRGFTCVSTFLLDGAARIAG